MYQGTLKFLKPWYDCSHCGEYTITKVIPTSRYTVNLFTGVLDYRQFIGYS